MIEISEEQARVVVAICRQAPCPDAKAKLAVGGLQAALEEALSKPPEPPHDPTEPLGDPPKSKPVPL